MFSLRTTIRSTADSSAEITRLKNTLKVADAVVIGAGAGLSTAAGFTYTGERFEKYFSDFKEKYGLTDMYSGGFFPFETSEEHWAYWSRYIYCNRYTDVDNGVYNKLFEFVNDKNYFVLTTNVDHQFQKAGFDKKRLFYTQGDYGLFQCSEPCHNETYDNEKIIRKMFADQKNMRVPTELVPICPKCGKHMTMNLRADDKFVQDDGWYKASERYNDFILRHSGSKILFLELGVGFNTPSIIKFPFWKMTAENPNAVYACINYGEAFCHEEIKKQSICLNIDISEAIERLIC
ncbi:MAG: Sir2 silent information regulator family NAD-dependent deacetylase [Oscillospiraceae bacterium]|nr:Sir2 silent information regulator family NAD-dependent deacetylase [Oscillospiraceae bacterium]